MDNSIVPQNNKTCTLCGKTYPATPEFYHRDKRGAFGLVARCKSCVADLQREYLKTEKGKSVRKRYKQSEKGKAAARRYRRGEAGKAAAQRKRDNFTDEQRYRRYLWQLEYSKTEKGKSVFRASQKKYRNSEHGSKKIAEYFRGDSYKRIAKRYRRSKAGRLSRKAINANYRARKSKAGGSFTPDEFLALCKKYNDRCVCCGAKEQLEADHIKPIFLGGKSNIENIQPLCRSCNASKGATEIDYRKLTNG